MMVLVFVSGCWYNGLSGERGVGSLVSFSSGRLGERAADALGLLSGAAMAQARGEMARGGASCWGCLCFLGLGLGLGCWDEKSLCWYRGQIGRCWCEHPLFWYRGLDDRDMGWDWNSGRQGALGGALEDLSDLDVGVGDTRSIGERGTGLASWS